MFALDYHSCRPTDALLPTQTLPCESSRTDAWTQNRCEIVIHVMAIDWRHCRLPGTSKLQSSGYATLPACPDERFDLDIWYQVTVNEPPNATHKWQFRPNGAICILRIEQNGAQLVLRCNFMNVDRISLIYIHVHFESMIRGCNLGGHAWYDSSWHFTGTNVVREYCPTTWLNVFRLVSSNTVFSVKRHRRKPNKFE